MTVAPLSTTWERLLYLLLFRTLYRIKLLPVSVNDLEKDTVLGIFYTDTLVFYIVLL